MITINGLEPTFATFPDGEVNVKFQPSLEQTLRFGTARVDFKFQSNDEILKLGLIINLLETYDGVTDVLVNVPFMPYSRMDRHEVGYHNPFSLAVVLNILKGYGESARFPVMYETSDVHNKVVFTELTTDVDDSVTFVNSIQAKEHVHAFAKDNQLNVNDILVVFPDKGAKARYDTVDFTDMPTPIVGSKTRDFDTHAITGYTLEEPIPEHVKHIVILDDVVSYGGTFIKLIKAIRDKTDLPISIITSHAENALWRGDLLGRCTCLYHAQPKRPHGNRTRFGSLFRLTRRADYHDITSIKERRLQVFTHAVVPTRYANGLRNIDTPCQ